MPKILRPNTFAPSRSSASTSPNTHSNVDISLIKSDTFRQLIQQDEAEAYKLDVSEIAELASMDTATKPEPEIPVKYGDFRDVFSKQEADKLPPHRPYDHAILVYSLSQTEIEALHKIFRFVENSYTTHLIA
ncbi:hypothetical protein BGZ65_009199 [Modicella reniformis]|uniref:Uncharacterized protein n=1 Tax=Modicella reniformis TaxID=1440133 RepID=A0A9P6JGB4_9FUNG|nr:hypothetical protein BGZ65_009199 [Modicella reniformis]